MRRVTLLLLMVANLAACGAADEPAVGAGQAVDGADKDGALSDVTGLEDGGAEDAAGGDVAADGSDKDGTQADASPADTGPAAPDCPGGAGCPCEANDGCDAGLCLEGAQGKRCAKPCVDSCDPGFVCAQIPQGSDVLTVCVDATARLCSPCETSKDCTHPGVTDARCLDRGAAGSFCGAACKADADCPSGYACKDAKDVDGETSAQCVPVDDAGALGACTCSPNAVALALKTACSVAVVSGAEELTCDGQAGCKTAGQPAVCQANSPEDEKCDGADNDCDGQTDESSCDDDNVCTTDSCDPTKGCDNTPVSDGAPCDADGSVCTADDACKAGACAPGAPLNCDDKNPCTKDSCDLATGCTQVAFDGLPCDDENPCTLGDVCKGASCQAGQPKKCSSTTFCVVALCDVTQGGKCIFKNKAKGSACDDGDACTKDDGCDGGACAGGKVSCDDGNPCTDDACTPASGCVYKANAAPCDDGDKCTGGGKCAGSKCVSGAPKVCDDGQVCTADSCAPKTGACVFDGKPQQGKPCDADGSVCTVGDACDAGKCVIGAAKKCDDGNVCTTDACDGKTGCTHVANTAVCSDGDGCTLADQCEAKVCKAGKAKVCDDGEFCTTDGCDAKTGGCAFAGGKQQGKPCDADGSVCTVSDACDAGQCVAGKKKVCDDGKACTDDACDPKTGCVASNNTSKCDDGDACTGKDVCSSGVCKGVKVSCDDSNPCTTNSCDKVKGCQSANLADETACNGGAGVSWCISGKCVPKSANGASCKADKACASGHCVDGVCCDGACSAGCLSCLGAQTGASDGQCKPVKAGADPDNDCKTMDASTCGFTGVCDGKGQCAKYKVGTVCKAPSCGAGGHISAGLCGAAGCELGKQTTCDDKNPCTDETCSPTDGCASKPNTKPCDADGSVCTVSDVCKGGKCTAGAPKKCDDGNPCTTDTCDAKAGCKKANVADETSCAKDGSQWCQAGKCVQSVFKDCKALKAAVPASKSGVYTIDPDLTGPKAPVKVYCDMVTDGGGWTLPVYFPTAGKVIRYYDFSQRANFDFKQKGKLGIASSRYSAKGLNLNGIGNNGAVLPYSSGHTIILKMRREFNYGPRGMLFSSQTTTNDDGITINGNGIGTRTHSSSYQLRGTNLSNLLPKFGVPASFGMAINPSGAVFYTATGQFSGKNVGTGSAYDSCTINAFVIGVNKYNFDPWKGGNLYLERLVIFSNAQSNSTIQAWAKHLDQF